MSTHNPMIANSSVSMSRESLTSLLKLIIQVVLSLLIVSGVFAWLLRHNQEIALPLLEWASVSALGLAAGLMARWRLKSHTQALIFLTAVAALAASLWMLGLLTAGSLGFSTSAVSAMGVNWRGLEQLGLGSLLIWISLATKRETVEVNKPGKHQAKGSSQAAIRKGESRQKDKKVSVKPRKPQEKGSSQAAKRKVRSPQQDNKGIMKPGTLEPGYASKIMTAWPESVKRLSDSIKVRVQLLNQNHLQPAGRAIQRIQKEAARRLKSGLPSQKSSEPQARLTLEKKITRESQKPIVRVGKTPLKVQPVVSGSKNGEIRLFGEIEHRCPFCLEIVEKNDPRGVRICKICHTYHHADCWDVTGTCQVPHHHE